jgi:hypothetical protein
MDIQKKINQSIDTLTHLPVPQGPSPALVEKTLAAIEAATENPKAQAPGQTTRIFLTKTGLAAMILIGAGFLAGRLSHSSTLSETQIQKLKISLLESMTPAVTTYVADQLTTELQESLVLAYGKLAHDVDQQMDARLNQYALQVLAVSQAKTQQTLGNLMELISHNEASQQKQFTNALYQLEYQHLLRDKQVRHSLATVTDLTQTHVKHTEELISLVAHEQKDVEDPNQI